MLVILCLVYVLFVTLWPDALRHCLGVTLKDLPIASAGPFNNNNNNNNSLENQTTPFCFTGGSNRFLV